MKGCSRRCWRRDAAGVGWRDEGVRLGRSGVSPGPHPYCSQPPPVSGPCVSRAGDPALAGHREAKQPPSRKTAGAGIFSAKPGTPAQTARRGAGLPFFIILIFMVNKKEIFSGSSPGQAEGRRRKNKHFLAVVVPFWRR